MIQRGRMPSAGIYAETGSERRNVPAEGHHQAETYTPTR